MSHMPAARVGDDVAHSNAMSGLMKGLVIGVAVGVLVGATIATGGGALAVVAGVGAAGGLASAGGLAGAYIGGASMGPPTGKFVTGSPNVLVNGRPATMTLIATAACSKESGAPIPLATGSSSVFINARMAGREGEKLGCSAVSVKQTSPDVLIGGASAGDPAVTITPEIPPGYITALQVVGFAGAVMALPFAIATVGVAATIGGGVLGFVGGKYGAQGGRALGEALGMSETGIRSLEVAGGFLGGMVGGTAGVKGGRTTQSALTRPPAPASAPKPFPYSPKKIGQTEPGAVPSSKALKAQMDEAEVVSGRSAAGYPDLPRDQARNFGNDVRPWNGDAHSGPIRRVIGADRDANGSYWQRDIPKSEAEWRGGSAVRNEWNGNGGYVESSASGLRGWIGTARPQLSSDGVRVLPGGGEQIWIPRGSAIPGPPVPTPWSRP